YPSGNPAVIISSTEKGKYSYILQEDTYEHSRENTGVLGVFDPTGHGSCYYQQTGKLRMVLTPFGGTFFDIKGEKKKKWFWYNITGSYVHAPPFQPITFAWTKELSLRCMGQDYIIITYNHGRHTIRFNVGARLKPVVKKVKLPTDEEYYEIQLKEIRKFVNLVIERVQTTLRFPHSHRINKLPMPERSSKPPSRIQSRVIDTAADDKPTVVVN
ncbi:Hypothetical predicted protein, partial [Paramuricea clavata]